MDVPLNTSQVRPWQLFCACLTFVATCISTTQQSKRIRQYQTTIRPLNDINRTYMSDALGGHTFNRVPVTADMIVNAASGRPQSHKPLQTNTT